MPYENKTQRLPSAFINDYMAIILDDITIRHDLRPGDLGYVIYLHGVLYEEEYSYGLAFEHYVAGGLFEFYSNYDPAKDRVWIAEYRKEIVGFLLLMHRDNSTAQLRYFIIKPGFRGIGLGRKMMDEYMMFLKSCNYESCYLWTTNELPVAASLYASNGFQLTEEIPSTHFGKPLKEQRYELVLAP